MRTAKVQTFSESCCKMPSIKHTWQQILVGQGPGLHYVKPVLDVKGSESTALHN